MKQEITQAIKDNLHNYFRDIHTILPGRIVAFYPDKCEATVSPTAKYFKPDGTQIDFPDVFHVPVFFSQGMGQTASIVYPVSPDDECLIFVSEQALDLWRTGAESPTDLRFDITNSIAMVGFFPSPNPLVQRAYDNQSILIQRDETFVELHDGKLEVSVHDVDNELEAVSVVINGNSGIIDLLTVNTTKGRTTFDIELDGQNGTIGFTSNNVEENKTVVNYKFDGQEGNVNASVTNYDTDITTISLSVDGQNGTVSLTTFDKDTGLVTGGLSAP